MDSDDPFNGTWKLNDKRSSFDPAHRPSSGTMHWSATRVVQEKPQRFILDRNEHPVPDARLDGSCNLPGSSNDRGSGENADRVVEWPVTRYQRMGSH